MRNPNGRVEPSLPQRTDRTAPLPTVQAAYRRRRTQAKALRRWWLGLNWWTQYLFGFALWSLLMVWGAYAVIVAELVFERTK
jgi:hypothetical protein